VEREWLAYGHKFGDRCGHCSEDINQRSPVFLQWLDCVHQLMRQFPCDFKFNEAFLVGTYNDYVHVNKLCICPVSFEEYVSSVCLYTIL